MVHLENENINFWKIKKKFFRIMDNNNVQMFQKH